MRLWKVLSEDRESLVSGTRFKYPSKAWTRHLNPDTLILCERGYHYCEGKQVLEWLQGGLLCEVETCPKHKPLRSDDKCVSCRLRIVRSFLLDERVLRLFAADCAERALLWEREQGREPAAALWEAVRLARLFAEGKASKTEMSTAYSAACSAARSAAWSAARSAAWSAEWSAARSAEWSAEWSATCSAARPAAWSAARSAVRWAAHSAERTWQYRRLLKLVGA